MHLSNFGQPRERRNNTSSQMLEDFFFGICCSQLDNDRTVIDINLDIANQTERNNVVLRAGIVYFFEMSANVLFAWHASSLDTTDTMLKI